jgi:hypothetical protein
MIEKICLHCGTTFSMIGRDRHSKFCNKSCAASYNNLARPPRSLESRRKMSIIIKERGYKTPKGTNNRPPFCKVSWCRVCNTMIKNKIRKTCSAECRVKHQSLCAKKRLRRGRWATHAQWYDSPFAGLVFLESSWEVKVAIDLDRNGIRWTRPSYLKYINSEGIVRSYYPDFYLTDYDVYLDPKNKYQQKIDKEKLSRVKEQNNLKLYVLSETELSWKAIQSKMVGDGGLEPPSRSSDF